MEKPARIRWDGLVSGKSWPCHGILYLELDCVAALPSVGGYILDVGASLGGCLLDVLVPGAGCDDHVETRPRIVDRVV